MDFAFKKYIYDGKFHPGLCIRRLHVKNRTRSWTFIDLTARATICHSSRLIRFWSAWPDFEAHCFRLLIWNFKFEVWNLTVATAVWRLFSAHRNGFCRWLVIDGSWCWSSCYCWSTQLPYNDWPWCAVGRLGSESIELRGSGGGWGGLVKIASELQYIRRTSMLFECTRETVPWEFYQNL